MTESVITTLNNSRFGRLKYDRRWMDARTMKKLIKKWSKHEELVQDSLSTAEIQLLNTAMHIIKEKVADLPSPNSSGHLEVSNVSNCSRLTNLDLSQDTSLVSSFVRKVDGSTADIQNESEIASPMSENYDYFRKLTDEAQKWDNILHASVRRCLKNIQNQRDSIERDYRLKLEELKVKQISRQLEPCEDFDVFVSDQLKTEHIDASAVIDQPSENVLQVVIDGPKKALDDALQKVTELKTQTHKEGKEMIQKYDEFNRIGKLLVDQLSLLKDFDQEQFSIDKTLKTKALDITKMITEKYASLRRNITAKSGADEKALKTVKELYNNSQQIMHMIKSWRNDFKKESLEKSTSRKVSFEKRLSNVDSIDFKFEIKTSSTPNVDKQKLPSITIDNQTSKMGGNLKIGRVVVDAGRSNFTLPVEFKDVITPETYEYYNNLTNKFELHRKSIESFSQDPSMKRFCAQITQAVVLTLNAIGGVNFVESYDRLADLLRGETVTFGRTNCLSLKKHRCAKNYCIDVLGRRIVNGLEKQLNNIPVGIYYSAAIAVALSVEFPEMKDILLSHLYAKCPALLPFYVEYDAESFTGFKNLDDLATDPDGRPSMSDNKLKNIVACSRFFASLLVTEPPPCDRRTSSSSFTSSRWQNFNKRSSNVQKNNQQRSSNPFEISMAWTLLANFSRLTPRFQITAIIICEILKICGPTLDRTYKSKWEEMIHFLRNEFLIKIQNRNQTFSSAYSIELETILRNRSWRQSIDNFHGSNVWFQQPIRHNDSDY